MKQLDPSSIMILMNDFAQSMERKNAYTPIQDKIDLALKYGQAEYLETLFAEVSNAHTMYRDIRGATIRQAEATFKEKATRLLNERRENRIKNLQKQLAEIQAELNSLQGDTE